MVVLRLLHWAAVSWFRSFMFWVTSYSMPFTLSCWFPFSKVIRKLSPPHLSYLLKIIFLPDPSSAWAVALSGFRHSYLCSLKHFPPMNPAVALLLLIVHGAWTKTWRCSLDNFRQNDLWPFIPWVVHKMIYRDGFYLAWLRVGRCRLTYLRQY